MTHTQDNVPSEHILKDMMQTGKPIVTRETLHALREDYEKLRDAYMKYPLRPPEGSSPDEALDFDIGWKRACREMNSAEMKYGEAIRLFTEKNA